MASICDRVLAVDSRIVFAMIVDDAGEVLGSLLRGKRLMPQEDITRYTGIWTVLIKGISKQMERFLGAHTFYSLGFDKLVVHGIPVGSKTIVVTASKDLPLETVHVLRQIAEATP